MGFSYLGSAVVVVSIAPLKNSPRQRTVNRLLADVMAELPACRKVCWATRQTTCLANQWAVVLAPERIEVLPEPVRGAKRIVDASYDPAQELLRMSFQDGTTTDVNTRS